MESAEAVASRVVEHIQSLPSKKLSGTHLAQFLRFAVGEFSPLAYGCRNLSEFVRRFVPDVAVVGRAGGDFLYGPRASQLELPASVFLSSPAHVAHPLSSGLNIPREVWKAYSSPNSLWRTFGNTETGELRVIPPGNAGPRQPWVVIPACSPQDHLQIANDFIAGLTDERQSSAFREVLGEPKWWDAFYSKAIELGLLREWQAHRRRGIADRFSNTLSRLKVPTKQEPVSPTISASTMPQQTLPHQRLKVEPVSELDRLRRTVMFAVERMSVSELRALPIPVGYIIDEHRRDA